MLCSETSARMKRSNSVLQEYLKKLIYELEIEKEVAINLMDRFLCKWRMVLNSLENIKDT